MIKIPTAKEQYSASVSNFEANSATEKKVLKQVTKALQVAAAEGRFSVEVNLGKANPPHELIGFFVRQGYNVLTGRPTDAADYYGGTPSEHKGVREEISLVLSW